MTTITSRRCLASFLFIISAGFVLSSFAQKPRVPPGGRLAIVADERLAALRGSPDPAARLIRRLSRGRFVSIRGSSRTRDGLTFYQVAINRRTSGWLQSEAVISSWRAGDDERLTRLLDGADEFDRVARARIFLEAFPRSPLIAPENSFITKAGHGARSCENTQTVRK
jgi:hypothetical protein